MRSAPSSTPERSLEAQYNDLLQKGITVVRDFEKAQKKVDRTSRSVNVASPQLVEEYRRLRSEIDDLIRRRVVLLKQAEHLETIEDAFPGVSVPAGTNADDVATMLTTDEEKGERPRRDMSVEQLAAFRQARAALAVHSGYEVDDRLDDSFIVYRGGCHLHMHHFAFPSKYGISGNSRISRLRVWTDAGLPDMLDYERRFFNRTSTDEAIWREIDRVVAIFG